ncbi:unnamed protein product [Fusarium graminearum]|uniref:Chromosome 4, complete genome n=2 Tax=Gibberella zeae TaxID=5518 RepID=A0A098DLX2_GIBZE|nr:unnamed protein product [Fusarium graminearum]CAF3462202.1 unnamed protein product [Fusarium graminearum]CAF3613348.1 unnamed protein product [Fusarium graminearum]CAG1970877.1 unnamed protein product [Fusarium graminearum]CAG1972365.1 unnamed protein product [Fusarium graminearum]
MPIARKFEEPIELLPGCQGMMAQRNSISSRPRRHPIARWSDGLDEEYIETISNIDVEPHLYTEQG